MSINRQPAKLRDEIATTIQSALPPSESDVSEIQTGDAFRTCA